jgi:hypothetical protein
MTTHKRKEVLMSFRIRSSTAGGFAAWAFALISFSQASLAHEVGDPVSIPLNSVHCSLIPPNPYRNPDDITMHSWLNTVVDLDGQMFLGSNVDSCEKSLAQLKAAADPLTGLIAEKNEKFISKTSKQVTFVISLDALPSVRLKGSAYRPR